MLQAKEFLKEQKVFFAEDLIEEPLVSVILPTYCRGDNGLLARAIDSVLAQSLKRFELIIVDDGSVDATQNVVKNYLTKDNRIVYIRNDINSGLPALRVNQGLMLSRGRFIAYQFDDDQWTKNALELLVREIEKQEGPSLVYGKCHISTDTQDGYLGVPFDYSRLMSDNYIANNSVLHSRELFELYGMYDCHLVMRRLCDWDLWVRWAKRAPFIYLDEVTSIVTAEVDGSLGKTVPLRFDSARKRMGTDRSPALRPENFKGYDIEDLSYIPDSIEQETTFRELVLPWKQLHCEKEDLVSRAKKMDGRQRIICTKMAYDSSVSIMLENYTELLPHKYNFVFFPDTQLRYEDFADGDVFVIARSINENILRIVKQLKRCQRNIPVIFYMDDNLFQYYKVDPAATYLAPGSVGYETLKELVIASDLVVTFNETISEEIRTYNPRVLTARTNIPERYLASADEQQSEGPYRIAFMGGGARKAEFAEIEEDLIRLSKKHGKNVEFYFYGFIPEAFKKVKTSTVIYIPFSNAYYQYLDCISRKRFDLILCPLYDGEFKRCKSPIKFLEAMCCGAVGLFSDVPVYECIQDGVTGYKIQWGESWFDRLDALVEAGRASLREIYANARKFVTEQYTTESQLDFFDYIIQTAQLHAHLKGRTILYACHSCYCAGAESLLLRHAELAKRSGASVLFALPETVQGIDGELLGMLEEADIETIFLPYLNYVEVAHCDYALAQQQGERIIQILQGRSIGLIHNCTLMPAFSYVADRLDIPQVTSAYQGLDPQGYGMEQRSFAPTVIHSDSVKEASLWMNKYRAFGMCIGNVIPDIYFQNVRPIDSKQVHIAMIGTFQPRKNQLGAVKAAVRVLKQYDAKFHIYGYSKFFPDYFAQCVDTAKAEGVADKIRFPGFVESIIGSFTEDKINVFLCASKEESIPQSMREAMAMGIPVVSTPVGNVPELITDGVTGYIAKGFEPEDIAEALERCITDMRSGAVRTVVHTAREMIQKECSELMVAQSLFYLYEKAFDIKETTIDKMPVTITTEVPATAQEEQAEFVVPPMPPQSLEEVVQLIWEDMVFSKNIEKKRAYRVISDRSRIERIGVVFATEEGNNIGTVQMRLLYKGVCLRSCRKTMESISRGGWTYFEVAPLEWCGGKEFTVELSMEYAEQSGKMGVYENRRNRTVWYRVLKKLGFAPKGMNTLWCSLR